MIRIPENLSTKLSILVNKCALTLPSTLVGRFRIDLNLSPYQKTRKTKAYSCWLCLESFSSISQQSLCPSCIVDMPINHTFCQCCALPLPARELSIKSSEDNFNSPFLCGECISQTPGFQYTFASYRYAFPVKEMIRRIKYQKQRYWLKPLTWQLVRDVQKASIYENGGMPDILIPIPMHAKKQKERTFNQAFLMAKYISRKLNIPINNSILLKTEITENQASLKKTARISNLKKAFSISNKPGQKQLIYGKHIALIDDVMTTKATAQVATNVLLNGGASRVDVWCLARTPKL